MPFINIISIFINIGCIDIQASPWIFVEVLPWSLHLWSPGEDNRFHSLSCFGCNVSSKIKQGVELKREIINKCTLYSAIL